MSTQQQQQQQQPKQQQQQKQQTKQQQLQQPQPQTPKYKICVICKRLSQSQCGDCLGWGVLWLIFSISDVVSTIQWELGIFGILGAIFWFILTMIFCVASCNLREVQSRNLYIEIIT
ncbi:unnamed protein product (macronuclear) [Paramecium tetraurelia]|uniref:LITAF domain-containing protein n=1 Tax=Paramecium tetraurelia TaxID=5888 RepID=A0DH51_PARTE|nr:uncharacterized protein GSPATT00016754001 [Paramecium tetraurelia]CAK82368.1 unnamed protein product [Paramecium tetraurelia]|eukprot:XP_001449765.1 hypothetical protein (macronuclear) [Paramecium tetraurelia strain d4-2]